MPVRMLSVLVGLFSFLIPLWSGTAQENAEQNVWSSVKSGDYQFLQELIDCGALIHIRDNKGVTPFLWACENDQFPMASFLLTRHSPINTRYPNGQTAAMRAAAEGRLDMLIFLQQRGADLELIDAKNQTAQELAAAGGHQEVAEFLHRIIMEAPNIPQATRDSALATFRKKIHQGAREQTIKNFLLKGVNLNDYNPFKEDPILLNPARMRKTKVVEALMRMGANPLDFRNNAGPLDVLPPNNKSFQKMRDLLTSYGATSFFQNYYRIKLLVAVDNGEMGKLKNYIKHFGEWELDFKGEDDKTPLMHAAFYGQQEAFLFLLEKGARPNTSSSSGWNPLLLATYGGHEEIVGMLLAQGVDLNETVGGQSALHVAVSENHVHLVPLLLAHKMDIDIVDANGSTPLIYAALSGNLEIATQLYAAGADPFAINMNGESAARIATRLEDKTMLNMFFSQNPEEKTDLALSVKSEHDSFHPKLMSHSSRWEEEFLWSLRTGTKESVTAFLDHGFQVNDFLENGWTPLMFAAAYNFPAMIEYLIEQGADPNKATPKSKNTALMLASMHGMVPAMRALIQSGAKQHLLNTSGHSAFTLAIVGGHQSAVRYLRDAGSSPTWHDLGEPLLSIPASKGDLGMVKTLVELGLNPNEGNSVAWTPLMYAARSDHLNVVRYLIENGTQINRVNHEGWSALTFAVGAGHLKMVRLLLRSGAQPLQTETRGPNLIQLAQKRGHTEIAKLLRNDPAFH